MRCVAASWEPRPTGAVSHRHGGALLHAIVASCTIELRFYAVRAEGALASARVRVAMRSAEDVNGPRGERAGKQTFGE